MNLLLYKERLTKSQQVIIETYKSKPITNKICEEYKQGTNYLNFYKEIKDIKELVGLHTGNIHLVKYEYDSVNISIIDKNNKENYITLSPVKARLLYDYFEKPTPTEILKYFV